MVFLLLQHLRLQKIDEFSMSAQIVYTYEDDEGYRERVSE